MKTTTALMLIDKLRDEHTLSSAEYGHLLSCREAEVVNYLHRTAREVAVAHFGHRIFIRGLIEISNCCRNDCLYCGIRKSNTHVERYRLDTDTIVRCCDEGYRLGFRTFVMQGGEDPAQTDEWVETTVATLRHRFPDCAITLSLGEKSLEAYERFFRAGANRYLLRHETYDAAHYRYLHPAEMSRDNRLQCLEWLREIGYQTGTGIMVGSPQQTVDNLVADLLYIERFRPKMIGIGPFIPHHDTPFAQEKSGSITLTLMLLSIFRLMNPDVLLPATTALATLSPRGREEGILAGANVVMPNLSPMIDRHKYELYNNKAFLDAEAAEGLQSLRNEMHAIGYTVAIDRGDYPYTEKNLKFNNCQQCMM
jgi:biotin synthase